MLTVNECLYIKTEIDHKVTTDEVKRLFKVLLTSGRSGVILGRPNCSKSYFRFLDPWTPAKNLPGRRAPWISAIFMEGGKPGNESWGGSAVFGRPSVIPVQPSIFIVERARDLNWVHGLTTKPMDTIHLASALEMGCSEFITTDKGIHSQADKLKSQGLSVIYAAATTLLPSKYRQLSIAESRD